MEAAVVRQLLDFFLDFLKLCQSENWPHDNTDEEEIKKAFISSQHISQCLSRLQSKELISDVFTALHSDYDASSIFLKKCLENPTKYVLKKIVTSNCKINIIDASFKTFVQFYSEDKLEQFLTDFMLESMSQETIVKSSSKLLAEHELVVLQSNIFLSSLKDNQNAKETIIDLLKDCNKPTLELLVVSLINKDLKYKNTVDNIVNAFLDFMLQKTVSCKKFWSLLFTLDQEYLLKVYLDHGEIFKLVTNALIDCGKLLQEQMSAEYFYIDLTYSQIVLIVQNISKIKNLEMEFFDLIADSEHDIQFWKNIVL